MLCSNDISCVNGLTCLQVIIWFGLSSLPTVVITHFASFQSEYRAFVDQYKMDILGINASFDDKKAECLQSVHTPHHILSHCTHFTDAPCLCKKPKPALQ